MHSAGAFAGEEGVLGVGVLFNGLEPDDSLCRSSTSRFPDEAQGPSPTHPVGAFSGEDALGIGALSVELELELDPDDATCRCSISGMARALILMPRTA